MLLLDFQCTSCETVFEELMESGVTTCSCPHCGEVGTRIFTKTAHICTAMIPTYPGCKRQKAGYAHTRHADQAATRLQSGYGGCQRPK